MADSSRGVGGVSRHRVLQGAAWTAPAIVIATAVPARAASLPQGEGITITYMQSMYQAGHWNATAGESQSAYLIQTTLQNGPSSPTDPSAIVSLQVTYTVPVGDIAQPAWGLGVTGPTNSEGIQDPDMWSLVTPLQVVAGMATLVFLYTGPPLAHFATITPGLWIQVAGNQTGETATMVVVAGHLNGNTSTDFGARPAIVIEDDPIP